MAGHQPDPGRRARRDRLRGRDRAHLLRLPRAHAVRRGRKAVDPIPAVERNIAFDLARRAALVSPVVLLVAFLVAGTEGLLGAAIALAVVAANFLAGALSLAW